MQSDEQLSQITENLLAFGETVSNDALRMDTPWKTHEFGFYDRNSNAIFIMQDAE